MPSGSDYDDSKVFIDLSNDYESLKISAVNPYIQLMLMNHRDNDQFYGFTVSLSLTSPALCLKAATLK